MTAWKADGNPLRLGPIDLGCVTFGREIDRDASLALLDHAWSHGVTFFDTAAAEGGGNSERILGDWFESRRIPVSISLPARVIPTKLYSPFTRSTIRDSVEQIARLEAAPARSGHSQALLALAWALHQPRPARVLIGGRTPAHLDQVFAAQNLQVPALLAELETD